MCFVDNIFLAWACEYKIYSTNKNENKTNRLLVKCYEDSSNIIIHICFHEWMTPRGLEDNFLLWWRK